MQVDLLFDCRPPRGRRRHRPCRPHKKRAGTVGGAPTITRIPDYWLEEGTELRYRPSLREIDDLPLEFTPG